MATSNFLVWDASLTNAESDGTYSADATRTNGAVDATPFPSVLANKLFCQVSVMVAAIGQFAVAQGVTVSDADVTALATALASFIAVVHNPAFTGATISLTGSTGQDVGLFLTSTASGPLSTHASVLAVTGNGLNGEMQFNIHDSSARGWLFNNTLLGSPYIIALISGTAPAGSFTINSSGATILGPSGVGVTQLQHARRSAISITSGRAEYLLSWPHSFGDTSYTVTVSVEDGTTGGTTQSLVCERIKTKSATQVGVIINNVTGGTITGCVIDAIGMHD